VGPGLDPSRQAEPKREGSRTRGSHCPSWARTEGGAAAEGRDPKQTAGAVAPAIAPPGLEPGLSWSRATVTTCQ